MPAITAVPSFAYKDGSIFIAVGRSEMRICWRPQPLAEERTSRGEWQIFWPEFRLLRPTGDTDANAHSPIDDAGVLGSDGARTFRLQKKEAFEAFRRDIPPRLAEIAAPFRCHQWCLLRLMAEHDAAVDLAASNPVLAYCLATADLHLKPAQVEEKLKQRAAQSRCKQREILGSLGFPATEAMVRLMRKLRPEAVSPLTLRMLLTTVTQTPAVMEPLAHVPSIGAGVLELVVHPRLAPLVTPKLLSEVAQRHVERGYAETAGRLLESLHLLKGIDPDRSVRPFTRVAGVTRFFNQVETEARRLYAAPAGQRRLRRQAPQRQPQVRAGRTRAKPRVSVQYPPPPVPGALGIHPITSSQHLENEGRAQHNCVVSYDVPIRAGATYIYQLVFPERATLSIVRGPDGCWRRGQLKGPRNRAVHRSTADYVDRWLAKYRMSV